MNECPCTDCVCIGAGELDLMKVQIMSSPWCAGSYYLGSRQGRDEGAGTRALGEDELPFPVAVTTLGGVG